MKAMIKQTLGKLQENSMHSRWVSVQRASRRNRLVVRETYDTARATRAKNYFSLISGGSETNSCARETELLYSTSRLLKTRDRSASLREGQRGVELPILARKRNEGNASKGKNRKLRTAIEHESAHHPSCSGRFNPCAIMSQRKRAC